MRLFRPYAMRPERSGPYSMPLLGGGCIKAEVREDLCRPWEILVPSVASEDQREGTIVNQRADSNKDVYHARPVQCDSNYHGAACGSAIVVFMLLLASARLLSQWRVLFFKLWC